MENRRHLFQPHLLLYGGKSRIQVRLGIYSSMNLNTASCFGRSPANLIYMAGGATGGSGWGGLAGDSSWGGTSGGAAGSGTTGETGASGGMGAT